MKGKRLVMFLTLLGGADYCSAHQPREEVNFVAPDAPSNVTFHQENKAKLIKQGLGARLRNWWRKVPLSDPSK